MADDISLDFKLHPGQLKVFSSKARFVCVSAGRRWGKSDLAAKRAIVRAMDPANVQKKPVWLVGPAQPQMKQIYWNVLLDLARKVTRDFVVNDGNITLVNGVQIGLRGADRPDNMRGSGLWDVTIDEYADMKPHVWESILRPALADVKGTGLFIGSPKGRNHFYRLCEAAKNDTTGEWEYFHFTTLDNPFIDPREVEAARVTMSAATFRQEFMASFETGGSDVLKVEWLKRSSEEPKEGDWFVAVDLAGFEGVQYANTARERNLDRTAIAVVKITPTGTWWVKRIEVGRWTVDETARRIINTLVEVKPVRFGIEKGALFRAVQPYLVSEAAKKHLPLRVEQLSHENENKTNRIVWALQGRMEHGKIECNEGPWMNEFEDEVAHFPSCMVHDDMLDALAYIEQLARDQLYEGFAQMNDEPYWTPLDAVAGF
jgi:predicted phage terminase large subunit-like protein